MARNKDYWARRAKRTQDALQDRIYEEYVAAVEEAYTDAIHAMDAKMRTWIQRLADNNEISYADAQKLLAKDELEEFHWSVEQYIKHGSDNLDGQWSKQLENASARVHISRYDAMKFELQALAKEATGKTIGTIKDAAALAYTESYNHTAFDLQQQVGVGVRMQGVDERKLQHVLDRPWSDDGKTFSARCWEGCDNLVSKVNRELFRMVATGEKPDRAIAAIADEFGKSKRTAGRLVMTESAAIASQAQHDCFTELGVEEFEVVGTYDDRMCDFCGEMNGQVFPESKRKIGENAPPFHPWCRCTTAPYDEDLKGVGERWMRDPETGKGGYVPSDMTYKEWKEIYVDKTSTMDEWNAKHVDKSAESGIINAYPGKSDSHQANEISQTIKAKVAEAESTVVRDIPSLSGWHEPIAYGEVESGLAEHVFDLKTGRCKITLLDTVFSDPTELASRLRVDYETHLSFEVESYQSLVAHELGHNAHTVLALKRAGLEYGKPLTRIEAAIFEREYNEISKEVYLAAFSNESFDEIQSICKTELGTMTYCNPHELIAQSFGNYYFGKKKSNVAKRIVKMFKRELR